MISQVAVAPAPRALAVPSAITDPLATWMVVIFTRCLAIRRVILPTVSPRSALPATAEVIVPAPQIMPANIHPDTPGTKTNTIGYICGYFCSLRLFNRPMISRAPTYDKYGKELSNYDRWRMSHGETVDTLNNNSGSSSSSSSSSYNNNLSSVLDTSSSSSSGSASSSSATKSSSSSSSSSRRRISRIEDDSTSMGSGGSILTTSR